MKNVYIFLTMLLLIALPASISHAQELVINGDLELWGFNPAIPSDWDKAEDISQETDPVHGGTYSAGHTSSSSSKDLQQDVVGIIGGMNYSISYFYYDNDTSAKTRIWSYWLEGTTYLDDNEAELRPDEYSSNNPGWQQYAVSLTAPANADGFRLEVRVYHENNFTGGKVYYDDFSIMAAGTSPEPTNYPTDFAATAAGISINLSWTDAIGDQLPGGYLVLASSEDNITAPADGTAVADDTDLSDGSGALNIAYGAEACSFGDLEANATYYFKIYPYTNGGTDIDYKNDGTAPDANASTADVTIIEFENFDNGWGNWDRISISGDEEWQIDDIHGVGDSPCAKCSGFVYPDPFENEDWLISPAMNFNNYTSEVLSFQTAHNYTGPALEVKISTDYDGVDPATASWSDLTATLSPGNWDWTPSGDIDISEFEGEAVYVAFKYTSTNLEADTWEVDEILITASESAGIGEGNNFTATVNVYPNPAVNTVNITTETEGMFSVQLYSLLGEQVLEELSFAGTIVIDLNELRNGIYLLHITDEDGNTGIEKLIVSK
ncbi:MAG: choice-of-anchor J domain-containing protein [Bacteroidota bacterium]